MVTSHSSTYVQLTLQEKLTLPAGTEMVMPGDTIKFTVKLLAPIALEEQGRSLSVKEVRLLVLVLLLRSLRNLVSINVPKLLSTWQKLHTKDARQKQKDNKSKVFAVETQKLRIRVRAYESKVLDASVKQIIDTARRFEATISDRFHFLQKSKVYTVNRSTFIYKNAREQFEMRSQALIDIINPQPALLKLLRTYHYVWVDIDVKWA